MRRLFIDGRVAYYTGSASELPLIHEQMGTDTIGVTPLPAGPNGTSGPMMQTDILMFNPSSTPAVRAHALDLALFLTNLEQANTFMRDLQLVPSNRRVRVDLRTYPAIAGFIAQTRTAITPPYLPQVTQLLEQGDDVLLRVLEGVITPNTAADELTSRINNEFNLETVTNPQTCDLSGNQILWHSWSGSAQDYLNNVTTRLNRTCRQFQLTTVFVPASDIVSAYLETYNQDDAPDILLTSSANLYQLVGANAVTPVDRDIMQAFSSIAQVSVSINSIPYGIPLAINGNIFFYNQDIIADAPVTTDELLVEGSPSFALARNADGMLWTLTAYNGITVVDNEVIPNDERLAAWVTWLRQVADTEHISINANQFLRNSQFVQGQSIYYVDDSQNLADLSLAMGNALGVAPFPTGTSPFASSLVTSQALFINATSDNIETATALANILATVEEQERMADALRWVPANTTATNSIDADPLLASVADILQNGVVINADISDLLSVISQAIDRALRTDQLAEDIARDIFTILNESETSE